MDIDEKRQRARKIFERLQSEARGPAWIPSKAKLPNSRDACIYSLMITGQAPRSVIGFNRLLAEELGTDTQLSDEGIKWKPLKSSTIYQYLSSPGQARVFTLKDGTKINVMRIR